MKITSEQLRQELAHCTGTENWYRHPMNREWLYTDGVQHFCEAAGAYWFMDILVTEPEILQTAQEFAAVTLTVLPTQQARITVTDGNENETFHRHLQYTDCPEGEWRFYMYNNVLMLTSEY